MKLKNTREPGLIVAIEAAGGLSALGRLVEVSPQAVSRWKRVPLKWVPKISRATGVSCGELRPDYFKENQDVFAAEQY